MQYFRYLQLNKRLNFIKYNKTGRNVLFYTACTKFIAFINLILKNFALKKARSLNNFKRNAIFYAVKRNFLPIIKRL